MPLLPDYDTAREEAGFRWYVRPTIYALLAVTGVPIGREYNLNPEVAIDVYRRGVPKFRELFPDERAVADPAITTPAISYGHVSCLGSELLFPEVGEVAHTHIYGSLEEGIRALGEPVDWPAAGEFPRYLAYREELRKAFPGKEIGLSFSLEGPLTTAYELRGDSIFYDLMDDPERTAEFLRLATASVVDFHRARCRLIGMPAVGPTGHMCDDIASMVPPDRFRELVLPFWDQYFRGVTDGKRNAHVEDLRADQLPFLEEAGLWYFDPSISHKLNPDIIRTRCRVPFGWRLGSFHYANLDVQAVRDWVFQAVADGASAVFTYIEASMCEPETVPKVHAFIEAAREAERILGSGSTGPAGTRADVGALVSPAGRARFWDHWPA